MTQNLFALLPQTGHILPWPVQNNRNEDLRSLVQQWWDFREVVQHHAGIDRRLSIAKLPSRTRDILRRGRSECLSGRLAELDKRQPPTMRNDAAGLPLLEGIGRNAKLFGAPPDLFPVDFW